MATNQTTEQLKDEVERLELQVKAATAQASLAALKDRDLGLPAIPDVTSRAPTITDKGGGAAAGSLGADVLRTKAASIVEKVRNATSEGDTIVLVDDAKTAVTQVGEFDLRARTDMLAAEVLRLLDDPTWNVTLDLPAAEEEIAPPPLAGTAGSGEEPQQAEVPAVAAAGPPAAQGLSFAIDLLDAIGPDVSLVGRDVVLSVGALRSAVAGALASGTQAGRRVVILPDQAAIADSDVYVSARALAQSAEALRRKITESQARIAPLTTRIELLRGEADEAHATYLTALAEGKGDKDALAAEIANRTNQLQQAQQVPGYIALSSVSARAKAVLEVVDAYLKWTSTRVDGHSPLQRAALAERITKELPDADAGEGDAAAHSRYLLHLDVTMAAGDVLTTSSLLFGTGVEATGSAQVVFLLTDLAGRVHAADELHDSATKILVEPLGGAGKTVIVVATMILVAVILAFAIVLLTNAVTPS
jgi:hypothetical protein